MRIDRLVLSLVLCIILGTQFAHAGKRDKPKFESKPASIRDIKLNLVPNFNLGVVVGDAADVIERWGGENPDKLLYGAGLSLVYYPTPRFGLGFNVTREFKVLPGEDTPSGRGWFYSSSLIYNLRPLSKAYPYARIDGGFLTGSYPRTGVDLDLGTHTYMRVGLGLFAYSSGKINMRYEIYYQRAFSEGSTVEDLGDYEIDFMAECIAVEFGIGIPLLSR